MKNKNKIVKAPNEILRKKVDDTTLIDDKYRVVAEYMLQTLQQHNAAGLAANQVGYDMPIIAIRIPENKDQVNEILFIINPQIVEQKGELSFREKCLSLPGITCLTTRSREVRIKGVDLHGHIIAKRLRGTAAVIAQHEIDHLEGVLMTDHGTIVERKKVYNEKERKSRDADSNPRGKSVSKSDRDITLH